MHHKLENQLKVAAEKALLACGMEADGSLGIEDSWHHVVALVGTLTSSFKNHLYSLFHNGIKELPARERGAGKVVEVLTEAEIEEIVNKFVDWWKGVPRSYEIRFPLPGCGNLPSSLSLGDGVEVRLEYWPGGLSKKPPPRPGTLAQATRTPSGTLSLLADTYPTLCVQSSGIAYTGMRHESAAARAVHTAKVALTLGHAFGILTRSTGKLDCEFAQVLERDEQGGEYKMTSKVALPDSLRSMLRRTSRKRSNLDAEKQTARVFEIGTEIAKVTNRLRYLPPPKGAQRNHDVDLANRIGLAAAWLHDALTGDMDANRIVRTAIAIEALYGGPSRKDVTLTIRNRLSYALAKTPSARVKLAEDFDAFYDLRSEVVHKGHTLLDDKQHDLLRWGEALVLRALVAETELLPEIALRHEE